MTMLSSLDETARIRSRKVMIATPVSSRPTFQYMTSLLDTIAQLERAGIAHECVFVRGNSNIPQARNELVAHFLASECADLVFLDEDIRWTADTFIRLLACEHSFCGVTYRKKIDLPANAPMRWMWYGEPAFNADGSISSDGAGFYRYKRVAMGFTKIGREVFDRLIEARPEWRGAG